MSNYYFLLQRCFDGGFTSNIPLLSDPNIISVTPFSGESSICPPMESSAARHVVYCDQPFQITSRNLSRLKLALYPTSAEALEELFHQGYSDSLRFFKQRGQCVPTSACGIIGIYKGWSHIIYLLCIAWSLVP